MIFGVAYGPAGAMLPELFQARYRYTGAGLGYNLAGIFGGAIPPLIAAPLDRRTGRDLGAACCSRACPPSACCAPT